MGKYTTRCPTFNAMKNLKRIDVYTAAQIDLKNMLSKKGNQKRHGENAHR